MMFKGTIELLKLGIHRFLACIIAALVTGSALASPPRAASSPLSGKLFQYSEPTGPLDAIFGAGTDPTPALIGNEIGDALREFADPGAAMRRLEELKRSHGFRGGRVYAGFTYRIEGSSEDFAELRLVCGISSSESSSWSDVDHYSTYHERRVFDGSPWKSFKKADRPARVRAIARCLAEMPEMPALRPVTRSRIAALYIDPVIYEMGTAWLRSREPRGVSGTAEQYRKAIRCMATLNARAMEEATGNSVVFRAYDHKHVQTRTVESPIFPGSGIKWQREEYAGTTWSRNIFMAVVNPEAVDRVYGAGTYEEARGLWPVRMGFPGMEIAGERMDEFSLLFAPVMDQLPHCRRHAGLFELPDLRLPNMEPAARACD